jgi:hypothetical protein
MAVRREAWGYVFWTPLILLLFLPAELIPAAGVTNWPTFSTTIGHLEYLFGPVALLVVLLMVFTGVNALARKRRHRVSRARQARGENGLYSDDLDGGRVISKTASADRPLARPLRAVRLLERSDDPDQETWIRMRVYIPGSAIVIAVLAYLTFHFAGYWWGAYVMWGLIAFFVLVLPSIFAWRFAAYVPFPTLFRTVGNLQGRVQMVGTAVVAFVVILGIHLALYPWPNISHVLKTASPQSPTISGKAVAGGTVTISGEAENCIRPEEIVVKSKVFAGDVTGTVDDSGRYSVQAKLSSTPTKSDAVTVYCGRPQVGETHFK